jgi:ribosomal RNA-processing protein 1
LRIPPSVTPRGSALKKGVPPGPIREMPLQTKKAKVKKGRRTIIGVVPSVKRLKKLRSLSV